MTSFSKEPTYVLKAQGVSAPLSNPPLVMTPEPLVAVHDGADEDVVELVEEDEVDDSMDEVVRLAEEVRVEEAIDEVVELATEEVEIEDSIDDTELEADVVLAVIIGVLVDTAEKPEDDVAEIVTDGFTEEVEYADPSALLNVDVVLDGTIV